MLGKPVTIAKSVVQWILFWLTSTRVVLFIGEPFFWLLGLRGKRQEIDLSQVKRVLIVRLDGMGDLVLTTPFLRELRCNLQDAWITLVVKPSVYNLVEFCPYVNEVLTYDWKTLLTCDWSIQDSFWQVQRHKRALGLALNHFWRRRFDLTILPRWDADYYNATYVSYFSGAPWRVGYSENASDDKRRLNIGYERLFTHVLSDNTLKHEVERNLNIIRFLGGTIKQERLELWVNPEDEAFAERVLNLNGICLGDLLVAFSPGAREPKRKWPLANFIELGTWLKGEYDAGIVVVGEREEGLLGHELQKQIGDRVINVVGQASLRQTSALLRHCRLCVSNDAGAMHLAAAAGVAIIEISCHPRNGSEFHSNSPKRFRPWGVPHVVLQPETALDPCSGGCNHTRAHCIIGVAVEQVKEAVVTQLSRQEGSVVLEEVKQNAV
jgi:heptosyltransferase-2